MTYSPDEPRDEKGQWASGSGDGIKRPAERGVKKRSSKNALRKQITLAELDRDTAPTKWNAARALELTDLKQEWTRRTGKEWKS